MSDPTYIGPGIKEGYRIVSDLFYYSWFMLMGWFIADVMGMVRKFKESK